MQNCQSFICFQNKALYSLLALKSGFPIINVKPVFFILQMKNRKRNFKFLVHLVKSCQIASISFTSWDKYCAVYFLLNSVLLSSIKKQIFDDSISYVEQEMDFQLVNIIPVKSCNFASLWYASRAKYCTVSWILYFYYQYKTSFFSIFNWATGNGISNF